MKKMSEKKELGVVLRIPSISFEGEVVGMVVSGAFGVAPDPEAHASLCRVIRVHARVGDMDSRVRRVESGASVGQAIGAATSLGSTNLGMILRGAKTR
jgi:hypothetical protein